MSDAKHPLETPHILDFAANLDTFSHTHHDAHSGHSFTYSFVISLSLL